MSSNSEAGYQPGDWHETLVDLLADGRGIPEDRARRFLARHAEEVRAAEPVTCHARECPCPPRCGCCDSLPNDSQQAAHWELAAQKNGDLYAGAENQRDEAREQLAIERATIARVQAVARDWEFMSGRREARRELLAALNCSAEEHR